MKWFWPINAIHDCICKVIEEHNNLWRKSARWMVPSACAKPMLSWNEHPHHWPDHLLREKCCHCLLSCVQRQTVAVCRQIPIHIAQRRRPPARNSARAGTDRKSNGTLRYERIEATNKTGTPKSNPPYRMVTFLGWRIWNSALPPPNCAPPWPMTYARHSLQ